MSEIEEPNPLEPTPVAGSRRDAYLKELTDALSDPLHKRIIAAYQKGDNPVASMEAELGSILTEILSDED